MNKQEKIEFLERKGIAVPADAKVSDLDELASAGGLSFDAPVVASTTLPQPAVLPDVAVPVAKSASDAEKMKVQIAAKVAAGLSLDAATQVVARQAEVDAKG